MTFFWEDFIRLFRGTRRTIVFRRVGACTVLRERRKGGSISLCVGIQTDLLIVVDVVMNGVFFVVVVSIFFSKKIVVRGTLRKKGVSSLSVEVI